MENKNAITSISLKEMENELGYEIGMFDNTCKASNFFGNLGQFSRNLLIESLAAHTRVLVDFFYCDNKKYKDDIIAQDLLPSNIIWSELRPELPQILRDAKQKADKQLAHLSLDRIKLKREDRHSWNFYAINQEMNKIIECFYNIKNN